VGDGVIAKFFSVYLTIAAVALFALLGTIAARQRLSERTQAKLWRLWTTRLRRLWLAAKPFNKGKILIGFLMIVTKVEDVYEMTLPSDVRQLLSGLVVPITFGLTGSNDVLMCMGYDGFLSRLRFWMILPAILMGAVIVAALAMLWWERWQSNELRQVSLAERVVRTVQSERFGVQTAKRLLRTALPLAVRLLFLIYPVVTNTAFEAFSCHEFERDRFSVLIADVSVTCTTDGEATAEIRHVRTLATLAICMYPVGLLAITAALLFRERRTIRERRSTFLSDAIRFLWVDYEPWSFWWEVCDAAMQPASQGAYCRRAYY
jgi:hypothetical protein